MINETHILARNNCVEAISSTLFLFDKSHPKSIVYVATNKINGKIYVGATEKTLDERKWRHLWRARSGQKSKFCSALRKYGDDGFEWKIIARCKNFFDALKQESWAIEDLKPEYNMTLGGGGVKGFRFSDESKAKMSLAKKGKKGSCSQKLKRRVTCLNDGKTYESCTAAGNAYGISHAMISAYCSGKNRSRRGLMFKYAEKIQ